MKISHDRYFIKSEVLKELIEKKDELSRLYQDSIPVPHLVLDDLFFDDQLLEVAQNFPDVLETKWWKYDNIFEKKLAKNDLSDVHYSIRYFINELLEHRFVSFLEKISGIQGLITDHTLNGGGLHQILRGGKLDIHADYNYHPVTQLDRRLNVLIYLNLDWQESWKGELELWDKNMTRCVKKIPPVFNRMVIFSTTDQAFHGHPEPLECPESESRKSIALYYYTHGRPNHEQSQPHSTMFQRRPEDPIVDEYEELREKRAQVKKRSS